MSSYKKCGADVKTLAAEILTGSECYEPLLDAKVTVDYLFAFGTRTDGELTAPALTHNGIACLGLASKSSTKDRALGRADCLVQLDGDWWHAADTKPEQRKALLDHELYHFMVVLNEEGPKLDSCKRPCIDLRQHDVEVGWFKEIAARHGEFSQERIQAKAILENMGAQLFWPEIVRP